MNTYCYSKSTENDSQFVIMKIYKSFFLADEATPNLSQLRTMTYILSLQRGYAKTAKAL